ncbi:MAG TPA: Gfo/Idh/MocA family oxidoreductase [Candidatus Parcubacteria bacterium]|jgi:predicted dehydrogenase|nr:Gfo/Idh/MocA family oxidoreductase [Candidatus Parcubacteria bacterium]
MQNIKIGFIGYKGHATRLIKIFDQTSQCTIPYFYHPQEDIDLKKIPVVNKSKLIATRKLDDLYSCDGIVISSPTPTHFSYLKKLVKNYRGYIFCEKPPVSSLKELKTLMKFPSKDKKRIYFDFNMRFGFLNEVLRDFPKKYNLGKPIRIAIVSGHGLAFKKSYKSSWRANKELHKAGVLETLGIHFFDLVSFLFGSPKELFYKAENLSPYGNSTDTCHLSCSFVNQCYFSLTCSYCIPFTKNIQINYTNGSIEFNAGRIKVFGPRESFDENGFFTHPPLIYEKALDDNALYLESLENSCQYFIDCIRNRRSTDIKYFKQSIFSNKVCLTVTKK